MFYAFDLLAHRGKDLRPMPLLDRKERLRKLVEGAPTGLAAALRRACGER